MRTFSMCFSRLQQPSATALRSSRVRASSSGLPATISRCSSSRPTTTWTALTVRQWSGLGARTLEVAAPTALWSHPGLPPVSLRWIVIRDPQGHVATQALLCTDLDATPEPIVTWFVLRGQLEVTCEAVRRHLGVETQRQWSNLALRRTTPALLGLFSLGTWLAQPQITDPAQVMRQAAGYRQAHPTFAEALALIRRTLWCHHACSTSPSQADLSQIPRPISARLTATLAYIA